MRLGYRIDAEPDRLRLPPPAAPEAADGLWKHTCCEAFVAAAGETPYREFNFSPSGEWAAYAFRACRERDDAATAALVDAMKAAAAPAIALRRAPGEVEIDAIIPAAALPRAGTLEIGLSVVLEAGDGSLSYWALHHSGTRPDFHRRDGFALKLGAAP